MRGTKVQLYQGGWRQYLCTKYAVLTTLNLASLHLKLGKIVATSHFKPFPISNETAFMHKRPGLIGFAYFKSDSTSYTLLNCRPLIAMPIIMNKDNVSEARMCHSIEVTVVHEKQLPTCNGSKRLDIEARGKKSS